MAETAAAKPLFKASEDGMTLRITLRPGDASLPQDVAAIKALAKEAGFGAFQLFDEALLKLPAVQASLTKETTLDIGTRRDGMVQIKVSKDEMEVTAVVLPPKGGDPVAREEIRAALRAHNVVTGIMLDVIDKAVKEPKGEPIVVARGTQSVPGEDARLESRIRKVDGARPRIRDDGRADMRELDQFVSVKAGDLLMVIVPPTTGKAGVNVRGQVIPAKGGKDKDFPPDLPGTKIDPKNPKRLLAAVAGRPVVTPEGIYVDPNLEIKKVDVSTGNIRFEGDISISGDISAGSKVIATGGVEIGGTVEAAVIESGGDIAIRYGVMGRSEPRDEAGKLTPGAAVLKSGGNVTARFLSNVVVDAPGDVTVEDTATHSEITAQGAVVIGSDSAKKGQAIGGRIYGKNGVQASVLGSPAAVKTRVEVGVSPDVVAKYETVLKALDEKNEELNKLSLVEEQIKGSARPDLKEKLARTRDKVQKEATQISDELNALKREIDQNAGAAIVVIKRVFPNVTVCCNGQELTVTDERGPGSFAIRDNALTYEPR